MRLIEIFKQENGSHANQTSNLGFIPSGYAIIPDDMETPNFPFGDITVEEIDGVMTVTSWTPGEIQEPPVLEPEPTTEEILNTLLGVTE